MASGTLGSEEQPREKHRWSENSKVYTRKIHKSNKNNPGSITNTANNQTKDNTNNNNGNKSDKNNDELANGKTGDKNNDNDTGSASAPRTSSPLKAVTGEANSSQPQPNSSRVGTVSEDSSSLNRAEVPVPNGHDGNLANGSIKRVVTRVDDRVNISVSAASSKEEVRELKRKLVDELDQIRRVAKKLEAKEIELSGYYSSSGVGFGNDGVVGVTPPVVGSFQFPVNGGRRVNPEMGSVGYNDLRPFKQLSVTLLDNNLGLGEMGEKEKRTPKANQYYRNSEFLLGKDKLPPESNKRSKSSGGRKHGGGEFDYGFGIDKKIFTNCSNLLQKLMKHKHGWVFNQPVEVKRLGLHDYFDIIKHPMDLGTVKTRLTNNWYKTPREFAEDVRLTFHNAMTYNPEGQDVHIMARELLRIFEDRWPAIETEYDRKLRFEMIRDLGVPTPTSRKTYAPSTMSLAPPPLLHPPPYREARSLERSQSIVGRTPAPKKPKANDPDKRDMTFEEKQRLSTQLQSLPSEKLDAIVQIIKKRNSALSQHDDEIEVDIDSVDTETLWELDRFVTNYKKNLSKHKRKAELALQARTLAAQALKETIPTPANNEPLKETRADEQIVATSPRVQQEKHGDNVSGSSSSSSSSSDSGSSSSDSDSDSSSSSGSDGGQ